MRILIWLLLFGSIALLARAQKLNSVDSEFAAIWSQVKRADGYGYKMQVVSSVSSDTSEKMKQELSVFSSMSQSISYTRSEDEIFFGNRNGYFKVLRKKKEAAFYQSRVDSRDTELQKVRLNEAVNLADSLMVRAALKPKRSQRGDIITYHLDYKPGYYMKSLDLKYNRRKLMLESVRYVAVRPMKPNSSGPPVLRQEVLMTGYEKTPPKDLPEIIKASVDFKKYLSESYPGFTIHPL